VLWASRPACGECRGGFRLIAKMASSTYERWRIGHRFTGIVRRVATVHAATLTRVLHKSGLLLRR